jgi:hypothetical protein
MVVGDIEGCQTEKPWRPSMIERERTRAADERGSAWRRVCGVAAVGVALASCTGSIGENSHGGPSGSGGGSGTSTGAGGGSTGGSIPPPPAKFVPQTAGLRRLTIPQYQNSVHDVLGTGINIITDFEPDTVLSGFASLGAARVGLSPTIVEEFEASALDIAKQALSNAATRAALVGCTPAGVTDDACSKQFLQKIGRRAWRRSLTDEEAARYVAVANNAQTVVNDFYGGLQYGLAGVLMSPHFLYREELGSTDPTDATRVVFSDSELATRLSYFLWNTTPDDQLLAAADARQLTQAGGLTAQTTRLLGSDRVAAAMKSFFSEMYRLADLDSLGQLASIFPQMTLTIGPAMREETLEFLNDIAFVRKADFRDVFDASTTFVNKELAKLYGLPAPAGNGFVATTLPASGMRVGLLGQASFLALNSQPNRSSPTKRGKFIREMLLCQDIPAPPPNVPAFPEAAPGTVRQRLTAHRMNPACFSCHQVMDPVGLGLENFDGIGAFRTLDDGQPIDASGDLDGVAFTGPRDLATALKNDPDSSTCIARNVYRYAVAHIEADGEQGSVAALAKSFQDNQYRFQALLDAVVKSPGFVYAAKPTY